MLFALVFILLAFLTGFIIYRDVIEKCLCESEDEHFDWCLDNIGEIDLDIAANPNTPSDVLEVLSEDKNTKIRRAVASNPNTPIGILIILSNDKELRVREAVASNSNT